MWPQAAPARERRVGQVPAQVTVPTGPGQAGPGPRGSEASRSRSGRGGQPGALGHTDGSLAWPMRQTARWVRDGVLPVLMPALIPTPTSSTPNPPSLPKGLWLYCLVHPPWASLCGPCSSCTAHPAGPGLTRLCSLTTEMPCWAPDSGTTSRANTTVCLECPGRPLHLGWILLDPHFPTPALPAAPPGLTFLMRTTGLQPAVLGLTGGARTSPQDRWTPRGQDTQRAVRYWPLEPVMPPRRPICPLSTCKIHALHRVHRPPHPPGERSAAF